MINKGLVGAIAIAIMPGCHQKTGTDNLMKKEKVNCVNQTSSLPEAAKTSYKEFIAIYGYPFHEIEFDVDNALGESRIELYYYQREDDALVPKRGIWVLRDTMLTVIFYDKRQGKWTALKGWAWN